ncbi:MAG TPA: hypothetical protein PKB07_09245 [Flavilitoribacter sp.]|nr:hypothetical protein [Flavilitoribacter sp.]
MTAKGITAMCAICFLASLQIHAQAPSCDASELILRNYQALPPDAALLTLEITPQAGAESYLIRHEFQVDGTPQVEVFPAESLLFQTELFPISSPHTYTVISLCGDGLSHTGASFTLLPGESGQKCPPITGLQIGSLSFNNTLNRFTVDFSWDFSSSAPLYTVAYSASVNFEDQRGTTLNTHSDTLVADALIHTFTIVAVCDTVVDPRFALYSPPYQFSIITVDDIKVFRPATCDICLDSCLQDSYQLICSEHGDFGQNHEAFAILHDSICAARFGFDWQVYHDSLCMNYDSACIMGLINQIRTPDILVEKPKVVPNPASSTAWLEINLSRAQQVEMKIVDLLGSAVAGGRGMQLFSAGKHQVPLPIKDLPAGLYWVVLRFEGGEMYAVPAVCYNP